MNNGLVFCLFGSSLLLQLNECVILCFEVKNMQHCEKTVKKSAVLAFQRAYGRSSRTVNT